MKRMQAARPTPAMIVAVAALIAAVGGTAVAGVATISKLTKQEKKQVKKISATEADKRIAALAGGLSVAHARTADSVPNAANAGHASTAANATNADRAASAAQADNAASLNGVRAIPVSIASATDMVQTLVAEGGLTIQGRCNAGQAEVSFVPTPGGGVLSRSSFTENGAEPSFAITREFTVQLTLATINFANKRAQQIDFDYLGTDGTLISGDLLAAQETKVAPCALSGTLFVH